MKTPLSRRLVLPAVAALTAAFAAESRAALAAYRNAVLADGATAYWELDETSGTTAADSAGGDNNGTYGGGVTLGQPSGRIGLGTSAAFNGSNGHVRILDSAVFDVSTNAFSVELWYRAETTARGDLFTYKGAGGDFGVHSSSQNANTASVYHTGNFRIQNAPVNAANGDWNHVVAVRDAGVISFYVNGAFTQSAADGFTMNITNDILIGSNHDGNPSNLLIPFLGRIDEVAFYPVALTPAQIANHFNLASVPEPSASAVALVLLGTALTARRRVRR